MLYVLRFTPVLPLLNRHTVDLIANGDLVYHVHAFDHLAPVSVLPIEERGVGLGDEELAVVVDGRVTAAGYAKGTRLEGDIVVLRRHITAPGAVAQRVAALDHPVFYPVENTAVELARRRLLLEVGDRVADFGRWLGIELGDDLALGGIDHQVLAGAGSRRACRASRIAGVGLWGGCRAGSATVGFAYRGRRGL